MCTQPKTGYTHCPHVYEDGNIEICANARSSNEKDWCKYLTAGELDYYWKQVRKFGKCIWCEERQRESPAKRARRHSWLQ